MTTELKADCQLCSTISRTNGEDPIGTARHSDVWIILERSLPWIPDRLMADPVIQPIFMLMKKLHEEKGVNLVPMLIAPDAEYSRSGDNRVIYYQHPNSAFSQYQKQEFLVPSDRQIALVTALLNHPDNLSEFESFRQQSESIRDIMVCTHGNVDVACARFGFPIYDRLRKDYSSDRLRVWRCSHFGGHQFAPTLVDLPTGQFWGHLEADVLDTLVYRQGEVKKLRSFYRGWAGLSQFGQIVDRELWMRYGWPWLHYLRSEIAGDRDQSEFPDWVELRLEFAAPDNSDRGGYEARVEAIGSVKTMRQSGGELTEVKQYRVTKCERY